MASEAVDGDLLLVYQILAAIGALIVLMKVRYFTWNIFKYCIRCERNLKSRYRGADWAAVTGATDGLGKAFAFELAKRGFNVMLLSRTQAKLEAVAKEINEAHPSIETRVVQADFSSYDEAMWARVYEAVASVKLAILINNVGSTGGVPMPVETIIAGTDARATEALLYDNLSLNCHACMKMTYAALRNMMPEANRGNKRGILTVASISGVVYQPFSPGYGGAKAFEHQFSRSLHCEMAGKVDVTSLLLGPTKTKMLAEGLGEKPPMMAPFLSTTDAVAAAALKALGHNDEYTGGVWKHAFMGWQMMGMPNWMQRFAIMTMTKQVIAQRDAGRGSA